MVTRNWIKYLALMLVLALAIVGCGGDTTEPDTDTGGDSSAETQPEPTEAMAEDCLLYTSPSPRDLSTSRMPSSA